MTLSYCIVPDPDPEPPELFGTLATLQNGLANDTGKLNNADYIWLPVYRYEHGNVAYSTAPFTCPWDSGRVGYIFISREEAPADKSEETILAWLKNSIEIYSQYCSGDVWGLELSNGETIWGFYGDDIETNGMKEYIP